MNNAKNYPINCGTMTSPPQWAFRKKPLNERNFEIIADEVLRITENGSVEFTTYKDLLLRNESFASYVSDFNVTASFLVPNYYEPITISSENTNVLTINESTNTAIASFESEGSCVLKGVSPSGETSLCKVNAQEYISQDVTTFLGYTNDSLAFNVTNAVDQRIVGKNSSHRPLYTTQNHASSIYVRNPDCLLSDIDLTCLSPWNSEGQTFMGGILVSPYHVLYCTHFGFYPNVGHTVRFITQDNTVVTRTITATLVHPDYDDSNYNYRYDFTLIKLDEKIDPVVDGISYAHVLPANWADYLPSLSRSHTIPVFGTNQFERVTISQECDFLGTIFTGLPPTGARASFYEGMIRFDSGSPQFIIVNDQVVVLGPVTGAGSGNGSFVSYHMTVLNNMMQQLGGLDENGDPYQLSVIDLSMFTSYAIVPPETYNEITSGGVSSGGSAIQVPLLNEYVTAQILSAVNGKNNTSRYFDGEQPDGLYGLDLFLNYYQNNVNSGTNDDTESTKNFVRNPNCWAYDIDLTCCSPWQMHPTIRQPNGFVEYASNLTAGTLISPIHVMFCNHTDFHPSVGAIMRFITKDNAVVTRTLVSITPVAGSDIEIGLLNEDVPNSITFAKVLPDNYENYFSRGILASGPGINFNPRSIQPPVLAVGTNQDECALIFRLDYLDGTTQFNFNLFTPDNVPEFSHDIRLYDSGSPLFIIIDNQPVLIFVQTSGTTGSNIAKFKYAINDLMSSSGYSLTTVDLSRFQFFNMPPPPISGVLIGGSAIQVIIPDGLPSVLYACQFVNPDSAIVQYEYEYKGNYVWDDISTGSTLEKVDNVWKISMEGLALDKAVCYISNELFGIWTVASDNLIPGLEQGDVSTGVISINPCDIVPPETYNEIASGGVSSGGSAIVMRITDYFYQQNSDVVFDLRIEADARTELKKIPDTYFINRQSVVLYEPSKFLEPTVLYSVADDWKQAYTNVKLKLSYNNNLGISIKHNETIVGARVKGYGSFKPYNRKMPLRIKSNNGISGLGSTKDVTLNNMAQSGSKISEYIIYKIFQDYGMPCPRANYVRLFINDSTVTISSISSNLLTTTANHYLFEDMRIKFVSLSGISDDQIFYVIERTDTTFKVSETLGGFEYSLPNFSGNLEFYIDYGEYVNVENPKNDYNLNENFGANNTKHLYEINITTTGQELVAQSYTYDLSYGDNDRSDLINFIQKLSSSSNWYQNISTCIDVQQFIKFSVMELYCGQPDGYCNFLNNSYLHSDSNGVFRLTPWGSDTYFTNGGLLSMDLPWSTWMQKCWAYKETLDIFKTELVSFHNWLQNSSGILNTIELIFNQKIQDFESDKKKPETETTAQATQAKNDMISFIQSRQDAVDAFLSRPYPPTNLNVVLSNDSILLSWDNVSKNVNGDNISGVVYNVYAGSENNLRFFTGPANFTEGSELATNSVSLSVGANFSNTVYFAVAALHNGILGFFSEIAVLNPPSEPPTPAPLPLIRITEVMSNSGSSGTNDWFELKNLNGSSVDITGWKIDDASGNFDYAVDMNPDGWSTISNNEVVVFFELSGALNTSGVFVPSPSTSTQITNFKNFWNIGSGPTNIRNVKIGTYGGAGIGLSSNGDGVVVFNGTGQEITRVSFGSATTTAGKSFNWQYDSSGNTTSSAVISQVGVNGAYQRVFNIASPGVA